MISPKVSRYLRSYLYLGPKRLGFCANFGHGDMGDDALLSAAENLFKENILPVSKRCYAFNPRILKGLLIGSGAAMRWEAPYIPKRLIAIEKQSFPVILFSAGINRDYGREFTAESLARIKRLCSLCDYLSVRDNYSREFLEGLGFKEVNIVPDLEFILEGRAVSIEYEKKGSTVGIALTPHSEFDEAVFKKIADNFSDFINCLTERGKDVIFLKFDRAASDSTRESDLIEEIRGRIRHKEKVYVQERDFSPEETLTFIKEYCDFMVCTRLHSALFSANAGVPFFCLTYNVMHDGFMDMIESKELSIPLDSSFSVDSMMDKLEYLENNSDGIKDRLSRKKSDFIEMINTETVKVKEILERSSS